MPKANSTPASSQPSRRSVCEKSVSPRSVIFRNPAPTTQGDGLIEIDGGAFVAGTIAAAIEQIQRLGRVGQRDQQRMVAPLGFMIDVHSGFALAVRLGHRAIAVDDRFLEERLGLLPPHLEPGFVECFLQQMDVPFGEPPAKVASRRGIGNPPRAKASRYTSSLRRSSRCSRQAPPASRL